MDMCHPHPHGVVVYASNNARQMGWAVYLDGSNGVQGHLQNPRIAHRIATWQPQAEGTAQDSQPRGNRQPRRRPNFHVYEMRAVANWRGQESTGALIQRVSTERELPQGNYSDQVIYQAEREERIGIVKREWMRNQNGVEQMMNDSHGMFQTVACAFHDLFNSRSIPFANVHDDYAEGGSEGDSTNHFFTALSRVTDTGLDFFAYSGHGSQNSLASAAIDDRPRRADRGPEMQRLASEIRRLVKPNGKVLLYACSTASGFAPGLSVLLPTMSIYAHIGAAQGNVNPEKILIVNGFATPFKSLLPSAAQSKWSAAALGRNRLWARYPFLTIDQIADEISRP